MTVYILSVLRLAIDGLAINRRSSDFLAVATVEGCAATHPLTVGQTRSVLTFTTAYRSSPATDYRDLSSISGVRTRRARVPGGRRRRRSCLVLGDDEPGSHVDDRDRGERHQGRDDDTKTRPNRVNAKVLSETTGDAGYTVVGAGQSADRNGGRCCHSPIFSRLAPRRYRAVPGFDPETPLRPLPGRSGLQKTPNNLLLDGTIRLIYPSNECELVVRSATKIGGSQ